MKIIMDLPPIDYTSTEDRAILRWKYMGEEILKEVENVILYCKKMWML